MSKYNKLWEYLKENNGDNYNLSYDKINSILGFGLDHSFLNYKKELLNYGYVVTKIYLKERKITFNRIEKW